LVDGGGNFMPLEQEVPNLLTIGFIATILILTISTILLWVRNKVNIKAYIMVSLHLVLLSTAFYFLRDAISLELNYNHPMVSEENSLQIGIACVFRALCMLSLLVAIFNFSSNKKNKQS
jgi:hypothetical protein